MDNSKERVQFTLNLFYNKTEHEVPEGTSVGEIVRSMNVTQFVVVLNGEYIPKERCDAVKVSNGDELKLLSTLLAGG